MTALDSNLEPWLTGFVKGWDRHGAIDRMPTTAAAIIEAVPGGREGDRTRRLLEAAPDFTLEVTPVAVNVVVDSEIALVIPRPSEQAIAEGWARWKGQYDGDY